jgi:hypothetical protein
MPVCAPFGWSGIVGSPITSTVHKGSASQVPPQGCVLVMDAQQRVLAVACDCLSRRERRAGAVLEHPALNVDERVLACRVAVTVVVQGAAVFVRHPLPDQASRLRALYVLKHYLDADRGPGASPLKGSVLPVVAVAGLAPGAAHPRRGLSVAGGAQFWHGEDQSTRSRPRVNQRLLTRHEVPTGDSMPRLRPEGSQLRTPGREAGRLERSTRQLKRSAST